MTMINCTDDYDFYESTEKFLLEIWLSFLNALSRILALPFIIIGLIANAVSVRIFSHRQMRYEPLNWNLLLYYSTPYMYASMTLAQTLSVWMTTVMSVHRFVGVCLPFKAQSILTRRNTIFCITAIIVVPILFNSTRFFEVHIESACYVSQIDTELPVLAATQLRINAIYRKIFYEWAYTVIIFAIPFTIFITVNTAVIFVVHRYYFL
ncbi:unnamed protein product [Thelazia callipaeda]|uniref:G_PROTEIN_RECEP_F1_2 domain-containing protein n=1 Tax=Thelazia callipaeda TaxID=103827 RepID=A0A0N5CN81_THECL|nr:unnamed protein product [Thelazia callipaeda]